MNIYDNPDKKLWPELCRRVENDQSDIEKTVLEIIEQVKAKGDIALIEFSKQFDQVSLNNLVVSEEELSEAKDLIQENLKNAIKFAKENIYNFHFLQKEEIKKIETRPGVTVWRKSLPIEKVGLYIPGGTAPLFSTIIMLAVPAQIAGVKEIIICTPPGKSGKIHPAVLYTAEICGINKIYKTGGAQAIAAMSFGTESIPKVYKIFGPGNRFVTMAKQILGRKEVAIDMPAGPSELAVFADDTGNPGFIAADLLSQAEHGSDSQVILVSTSKQIIESVKQALEKQVEELPRKDLVNAAFSFSNILYFNSAETALDFLNEYAPEHLIIASENYKTLEDKIKNAGSVFLGNYSPEAAGDYASGTNHTLPTNGYAKAYSGVSVDSFVKKITFQQITKAGLKTLGEAVELMAEAEGLTAHKNAIAIRMNK